MFGFFYADLPFDHDTFWFTGSIGCSDVDANELSSPGQIKYRIARDIPLLQGIVIPEVVYNMKIKQLEQDIGRYVIN